MNRINPLHAGAVLAAACATLLAGCGSQPPVVDQTLQCRPPAANRPAPAGPALVTQGYGTTADPIPLNAVLFTDNGLAQRVAVQSLASARTEGETVQVTVRLLNCADQPLMLRARTSFMLASGAAAELPSAWQLVALPAKATGLYSERSLARDQVAAYLVELAPLP